MAYRPAQGRRRKNRAIPNGPDADKSSYGTSTHWRPRLVRLPLRPQGQGQRLPLPRRAVREPAFPEQGRDVEPAQEAAVEWFDADNDRLFFHFERVGAEGKVRSVSGTGKYQRVSMEGTYEVGRFAQTPGLLRGCSHNKGRWDRQ